MKLILAAAISLAVLISNLPAGICACNYGIGKRATGDYLLQTIVVTAGPVQQPTTDLEVTIDYKASPLRNEEFTMANIVTESTDSCSLSRNPQQDFTKHVYGTFRSIVPVTELKVQVEVYGYNWMN